SAEVRRRSLAAILGYLPEAGSFGTWPRSARRQRRGRPAFRTRAGNAPGGRRRVFASHDLLRDRLGLCMRILLSRWLVPGHLGAPFPLRSASASSFSRAVSMAFSPGAPTHLYRITPLGSRM